MRLIDADKVDMPIMQRKDNEWVFRYNIREALDTLPTVNAIPIEWLRKYTNHRTIEFGDMWVFINCMINDWEKENEKDI